MPYKNHEDYLVYSRKRNKDKKHLERNNKYKIVRYENNPEYKVIHKKRSLKRSEELQDSYVIFNIKRKFGLTKEQILNIPGLLEMYREHIKLIRLLKNDPI